MFLIESQDKGSHTELVIFSRNKEGKKEVKIVKDFKPYLYVLENAEIPDDYRIVGSEKGYKSILGKPLKKIFVKTSKEVVGVRSMFEEHYEADILFTQRYIIDKIGEVEPYPLKTLYFDIEIYNGVPVCVDRNCPEGMIYLVNKSLPLGSTNIMRGKNGYE